MEVHSFLALFAPYVLPLAAGMVGALVVACLIVLTPSLHGAFTMDHPGAVQTAHRHPTPRVGGVGIYLGLLVAWWLLPAGEAKEMLGIVLIAGLPAWLFGLAEDVTKRVSVLPRLLATMCSGALACYLADTALSRVGVPLIDSLLAWWPLALLFTAFAVGGVANAINIIDGFHGLASGTSIIALVALAVIAQLAADPSLALVSFALAAVVAGFWLVNYPWGKIFLGDGGAYFAGFGLAWVAVLLPMRNPEVSPWASLVVCSYPIIEVVYSMARRFAQRMSLGQPDSQHLHSLFGSQLIRRHAFGVLPQTAQNAAVAPLLWAYAAATAWLGVTLRESTAALFWAMLISTLIYHLAYRYLIRRQRKSVGDLLVGQTHSARNKV